MSFLHSELSKQIAFPRKALDVDFGLYEGGLKGRVSYLACSIPTVPVVVIYKNIIAMVFG